MTTPRLIWDRGTAYDLFISLMVMHKPADFNLRPAWAAGMRSRLPAADREFLEALHKVEYLHPPLCWLHNLPDPKDGRTALYSLEQTPAAERLGVLLCCSETSKLSGMQDTLFEVARRGTWDENDRAKLERVVVAEHQRYGESPASALKNISDWLELWAHAAETGNRLLRALRSYYDVFFVEEERRIGPALDQAIAAAQEIAERSTPAELLEELSQGVQFSGSVLGSEELVLVPTYWCSPLVLYDHITTKSTLITFGARPSTDSLISGETVPDALVVVLKALSDPTRLRILRYLGEEAQTPSQLARSLRLRPPTVIHHLTTLRMAGLVQVNVAEGKEKSYSVRVKAIETALGPLKDFLGLE